MKRLLNNTKLYLTLWYVALVSGFKGWSYPLMSRRKRAYKFRLSRVRMETALHEILELGEFGEALAANLKDQDLFLIARIQDDGLWVDIHRPIAVDEKRWSSASKPSRDLYRESSKFTFALFRNRVVKVNRPTTYRYDEGDPIISYHVPLKDRQIDNINEALLFEGPYINSEVAA